MIILAGPSPPLLVHCAYTLATFHCRVFLILTLIITVAKLVLQSHNYYRNGDAKIRLVLTVFTTLVYYFIPTAVMCEIDFCRYCNRNTDQVHGDIQYDI